jgi:hypothetical protein
MQPLAEIVNIGLAASLAAWLSVRLGKSEEHLRIRVAKLEEEMRRELIRVITDQTRVADRTLETLKRVEKHLDEKSRVTAPPE